MKNPILKIIVCLILLFANSQLQAKTFIHRYDCEKLFHTGTEQQMKVFCDKMQVVLEERQQQHDDISTAEISALLSEAYKSRGLYKMALDYGNQAVSIYQRLASSSEYNSNVDIRYSYALALSNMAYLNNALMENIDTTLSYYSQSIDEYLAWMKLVSNSNDVNVISEQQERISYIDYPIQLTVMMLGWLQHDYAGAVAEGEKLLKILEGIYPGESTNQYEYAEIMMIMASIYVRAQDFEQAQNYSQKSLDAIKRIYGENNVYYARILSIIGNIYYALNDLQKAAEYYVSSSKIYEALGYTFHADHAETAELGAAIMLSGRDYKTAAKLYDVALNIIDYSCGEKCFHHYLNRCYATYPILFERKYDEAAARLEEIMSNETFLSNLTGDYIISAYASYFDIAVVRWKYSDVFDNMKEAEETIKVMKDKVGQGAASNMYIAIGRAFQASNRFIEACAPFSKAEQIMRDMAHQNFSFLTEQQRDMFWERDKSRFESILRQNITTNHDGKNEMGKLLYDASLLQKSLLLNASVNMGRIIESKGTEELKSKMRRLRLMMQGTLDTNEQKTACQKLEKEVQDEARRLGDFMDFTKIAWQDVKAALTDNEIAIEFVCSTTGAFNTYSAEILRRNMASPYHVFLFSCDKGLSGEEFSKMATSAIKQRVLPHANPGDHIYFAPVGELHNLPLEYLQQADGKRLNEVYQMQRVTSTRQIIAMKSDSGPANSIALFGGLNYNSSLDDMELQAMAAKEQNRSKGSSNSERKLWTYLPGTMQEVKAIAPIMQTAGYKVQLFTQDEGVEESVKALSETSTSIIHIATHGYFSPSSTNSLQNSGLIFAGANNFLGANSKIQSAIDDGVLTAEEIANLNLIGTKLVVLSACQSGLGTISGEGVFGLQRAFKKAGVQSILMSLWEVDDEATQILMTTFYQHLTRGASKYEALKMAQDTVRGHTFIRNGEKHSGSDPHYWASFVIID